MTIDEVIEMIRTNICNESNDITKSVWLSIAEWLEELKTYRECNVCEYNKAIDDFVKFASDMPTVEEEDGTIRPMWLEEIAEQLKAGGDDE